MSDETCTRVTARVTDANSVAAVAYLQPEIQMTSLDFTVTGACDYGPVDDLKHMEKCLRKYGLVKNGVVVNDQWCLDKRPSIRFCDAANIIINDSCGVIPDDCTTTGTCPIDPDDCTTTGTCPQDCNVTDACPGFCMADGTCSNDCAADSTCPIDPNDCNVTGACPG